MTLIEILNHANILHVVATLFLSLLICISYNKKISYYLSISSCVFNAVISALCLSKKISNSYEIGNFNNAIGIEHIFDKSSETIILYLSAITLLFLLRKKSLFDFLDKVTNHQHLFFFLLSINYLGMMGIVLTYDMFNTYVFIEILSISTCVLLLFSDKASSFIGGINYLIYASFSATLILIGVGVFLFSSYTLSINHLIANNTLQQNPALCAIFIIYMGFILKIGIYPLSFVISSAYKNSSYKILSYVLSAGYVVNLFAAYKFSKIIHFSGLFTFFGVISSAISSFFAIKNSHINSDIRKFLLYFILASNGYSLVAFDVFHQDQELLIKYLILDGFNKFSMLFIISAIEDRGVEFNFKNLYKIKNDKWILYTLILVCLSIMSIPFNNGFAAKLSLYHKIALEKNYILLFIMTSCSTISLIYVFKIIKYSYLSLETLEKTEKYSKVDILTKCAISSILLFLVFGSIYV